MRRWRKVVTVGLYQVERQMDTFKFRLRKRFGRLNAVTILAYRGHGTPEMIYLKGRVIEQKWVATVHTDSAWRNLLNTYRRFASDEIGGARVRATFGGVARETVSDRGGYFEFALPPDPALLSPKRVWYDVTLELVEYPGPRQADTRVIAPVIVPPPDAEFGVISDLDDTVIQSDVVHLLKLARNTFLKNSHTRLPFEGVAAFYHALQAGTRGSHNPIYYVSSSPWNLYDLIVDFFDVRGIPPGPLFMADLGITAEQLLKPDRRKHKLTQIRMLLATHPTLPFILIGDSGEVDPDVYLQTVEDYPGRIKAIYIRDVNPELDAQVIASIAERVRLAGSEMLLVKDTVGAAVHAAAKGFILPEALPIIRQERNVDKKAANYVEDAADDPPRDETTES